MAETSLRPRRVRRIAWAGTLGLVVALLAPTSARADDPLGKAKSLLESSDWKERIRGLDALGSLPDRAAAARAAISRLEDDDWEVQIRAAAAVAKIGGEDAKRALIHQAIHGNIAWVREAAGRWLAMFHDDEAVAQRLLERARAEREEVLKSHAIRAAGRLAPAALLSAFRPWVLHRDPDLAAAGTRAVARLASRGAPVEELLKLLAAPLSRRAERKHFLAYAAAIDALGECDAPAARVAVVRELLLQEDEDGYVPTRIARHVARRESRHVASAVKDAMATATEPTHFRRIARLAGEAGIDPLGTLLRRLAEHADASVRAEAVRALGLLRDAAHAAALRERLGEDRDLRVRVEAIIALARTLEPSRYRELWTVLHQESHADVRRHFVVQLHDQGDPQAIPVLASFVRDRDWRVATAAIAAIGTLGIAKDLPLVVPHARHKDWKVRASAFEAMGRLRAAKAFRWLVDGLEDGDPVVRGVCLANLQIMTRQKFGPVPKTWERWIRQHGDELELRKRSRMTPEEKESEEAERSRSRYAHDKYRFDRKRGVEILQKARIVVVTGAWDHVEVVLEHLGISNTTIRAQQLKEIGLNPNQVVLVNCEGNVDKDSQERLRWFVNVGGYLMTTDWALTKTVQPCFPGYMEQYPGSTTGNDVVVVEESRPGHPFTAGIFERVPALMWWLEVRAFPIEVTYPERCRVIVDSAEMRRRYGSSPMATEFRWGLGKVQHSISHFYLQEEGLQKATKPRARMIFAADNLGLSLAQIRRIRASGGFEGQLNEETMREIAPDYSMFRLIVNVVKEKSDWVEGL